MKRLGIIACGLCLLVSLAGCGGGLGKEKLETIYGRVYGTPGLKSVNGTSVLARMCEERGATVSVVTKFSPRLERANVIIWAPDDFSPPSQKHRDYLEEWLRYDPNRTVIYIGRDYDSEVDYWRQALPLAQPQQQAEFHTQLAEAISRTKATRQLVPANDVSRWFKLDTTLPTHKVAKLEGPWADRVDAAKCNLELNSRFLPPKQNDYPTGEFPVLPEYEVLLSSDQQPLITRVPQTTSYGGQLIVVTNGSFLLNFPLVNKEHRKLAGRLLDECGHMENVVFVESGAGGPPIHKREEEPRARTGFDMLTVWPLNVLLLHLLSWLLVLCVGIYPIFGRPKRLYEMGAKMYSRVALGSAAMTHSLFANILGVRFTEDEDDTPLTSGDFGHHLDALGEMLSLSKDQQYAEQKLAHYHQHVKRDSGVSHVGPARKT